MVRVIASVLGALLFLSNAAHAATTLKIASLAPQDSPWAREFKRWAADVAKATGGEVRLDFQWNGQAGDEVLMVQKIRTGQIDGAAVTAIGLAQTGVTDILALQLPGLFSSWSKLDEARNAMKDEFSRQFESKGFTILGWGDVGAVKTLSVGLEVRRPSDLQRKGCYVLAGDVIGPRLFADIGGMTPRALAVPEILPGLTNGSIAVVSAPPLVAEQLQWASRVTHINTTTTAYAIGALIFSSARMQSLSPSVKDAIAGPGLEMSDRLSKSIRALDAQALARLKSTKIAYEPNEDEKHEWRDLFARVRQELRGTVFSPAVFDRLVELAR